MKEDTINIAGVSCKVSKIATLSYESLYDSAVSSLVWQGVKDAKLKIDKELRDNGFKPVRADRKQTEADKPNNGGKSTSKRASSKRKRDPRPSKR